MGGGVPGTQASQSGGQQQAGTGKFGGMASQGGGGNPFQQYQGMGVQQAGQQTLGAPQTQQQQPFQGQQRYQPQQYQQQPMQQYRPQQYQPQPMQRPFQAQQPNYASLFSSLASMFGGQQGGAPRFNYNPVQSANNFQLRNTYQFDPATDASRQYAARVQAEANLRAANPSAYNGAGNPYYGMGDSTGGAGGSGGGGGGPAGSAGDAGGPGGPGAAAATSGDVGDPGASGEATGDPGDSGGPDGSAGDGAGTWARGGHVNPNKKIRAALMTAKGVQAKAVPEKAGGGALTAPGAHAPEEEDSITAYHGSPHQFDEFDPEEVHWFAKDEKTARLFGKSRMKVPLNSPKNPVMYEVKINGKLQTRDPMAEATEIAKQINEAPPSNWDEVGNILQWPQYQRDVLDEAHQSGFDGVRFVNVGDVPGNAGGEGYDTHYAITNPKVIQIKRRYATGGGALAAPGAFEEDGGRVGYAGGGGEDDPTVQKALGLTQQAQPTAPQMAMNVTPQATPKQYKSWQDVPVINPQDLVGKSVFPIFADLTKANADYTGIDSSALKNPERLFGGPGYPLMSESQKAGLGWAVEGKGRGSAKIRKKADYVLVSAMMPDSHKSNASFSNALMKTMGAYAQDNRLPSEAISSIDEMIRRPTAQNELQELQNFPGFAHPDAEKFLRGISFEQRKRVADVLASKEAQGLGAPNIDKITRETLDPEFSGIPSRHGMFLLKIAPGSEDEQLVHLKEAGLPEHPSYQYGIKGEIVGRFHHPVAPEIMFKDWFDRAHQEAAAKAERGEKSNVRRAFDLAMPTTTVTQEVADMLPRHPKDIQSGKAAKLALNAFNDQWNHTDTPVNAGGIGAADFSQALKNSDFSSTLSQYSPQEINLMKKEGKFTGYKLKDGEVYFGLKRGTNYADDYGFEHPELTPNETALVSVVNNEPGAKGIGGAPVVLKALQEGATALDCYAVPSKKHPEGFLPSFYEHFGFKELGRVPFDPQYVTETQFNDMKHQWRKSGWNESMGLPSLVIMKWNGKDEDRSDAVRRFVRQSSGSSRPQGDRPDVRRSSRAAEQRLGAASGQGGVGGQGDAGADRGAVRADRNARPSDRFARTLSEVSTLTPEEAQHFGLSYDEVEGLRSRLLGRKGGGRVGYDTGGGEKYQDPQSDVIKDWNWRPLADVQNDLQLTEIPSHVQAFGKFMDETAAKASGKGLTPRDLIKAYTITRSSIQRQAVDSNRVRAAGLALPDDVTGKIRPEGAFGEWLHSDMGQKYLRAAERGEVDPEAVRHAVQVMAPFGKHEKDIPDALIWAAKNLPGREKYISDLVARGRDMVSTPEEWRGMTKDVRGIGPSKSGFVASLLGRGDQPTLDARQVILHTGRPTKEASPMIAKKGGKGGVEAVDRLAARQEAMGLTSPELLKPYYQHLAHHTVWDKAGNEETTHEDVMNAMRHAATGGAIAAHPLVDAMRAAGLPGLNEQPNKSTLIDKALQLTRKART